MRRVHWWVLAAGANVVIFVAYLAIALVVARGIAAGRQWRSNPLAVATSLIFFSCGVGHGLHGLHLLAPSIGVHEPSAAAQRVAENEWHVAPWEALTAMVGIWYWTLRGRFPALLGGGALFEDLHERQRRALELNDGVVQGLAAAKLSFEVGNADDGMRLLEATLAQSRGIVTGLLGDERAAAELRAGALRRDTTADVMTGARPEEHAGRGVR